jgi:hypothetical protein
LLFEPKTSCSGASAASPHFANGAGAGEYRRRRREFAVELAEHRPAIGESIFEADSGEGTIACRLRRIDQEIRTRQALEEGATVRAEKAERKL